MTMYNELNQVVFEGNQKEFNQWIVEHNNKSFFRTWEEDGYKYYDLTDGLFHCWSNDLIISINDMIYNYENKNL